MASFLYNPRRRQPESSAWSNLPPQLLETRLAALPSGSSAPRGAPARGPLRPHLYSWPPFEAPLLLRRGPVSGGGLAVFSLRRREILPFALPAGRCCGQIGGWLAMASDGDRALALCNIFSGESVSVARALAFPVAKLVLSAPPTSPCWVAALLSHSGRTVELVWPNSVIYSSCRTTVDATGSGCYIWTNSSCATF
ncbi:hypothetical protein D1007_29656 [Hordeum vulgare]|nr:hypothetical protein D1007_29656 [Hordeum vulgare]